MDLIFKKIGLFLSLLFCAFYTNAQVSINLTIKPPFTPFISDYTNPARLQDINVSLFNQSANKLRLKFKLTLKNEAKGIEISIKETINPLNPMELEPNEFKFIVLEDVSNLYGKLNQNSFNIKGADIQNLILDGTIPDGIYQVCIQAFNFDAVGFSQSLSANSPLGCFTFQVNYTDPPTDIRLNSTLLQYSFGGTVPKVGVNKALGQNYNIQFTTPALNIGSSYTYELFIYDGSNINPSRQRESSILEAINTIIPIVNKTSSVPFFTIDPGDVELDFNKDYFMLIKATDLNNKTLFKNIGYSTFKAFNLIDIQPLFLQAPSIDNENCGKTIAEDDKILKIKWKHNIDDETQAIAANRIKTRVKIIRLNSLVIEPKDILQSNIGELLIDTFVLHTDLSILNTEIKTNNKFGNNVFNNGNKWIIAVQNIALFNTNGSSTTFNNNGKAAQCVIKFNTSTQTKIDKSKFNLEVDYPLQNDTIPFQYAPIVIKTNNRNATHKIIFTQFNSILEPIESNKYLKLTTEVDINRQLNSFSFDSALTKVNKQLNIAADYLLKGNETQAEQEINKAITILNTIENRTSVQLTHALGNINTPLGNGAKGKYAILANILKYQAFQQLYANQPNVNIPNLENLIYLLPYKNNIIWTAKMGVYDTRYSNQMSLLDYENKFRLNSFTAADLRLEMLKAGFNNFSGKYHVGMGMPILDNQNGRKFSTFKIALSFMPSKQPKKLLPTPDNNDAWREFENLSVAQQWNVEISRQKNFKIIDTTISKRIAKVYDIRKGSGEIIKDLYSKVNLTIQLKDTGKFYWRVTWSNPTLPNSATTAEKQYYSQLMNLLANNNLLGNEIGIEKRDSFFFIPTAYCISAIDSFSILLPTKKNPVLAAEYEVIYPLQNDTIPFYYPPTVIKMQPVDVAYKFLLSKFNSTLEPFENLNYYIIDSLHPQSKLLRSLGLDSLKKNTTQEVNTFANLELTNGEVGESGVESMGVFSEYLKQTEKKPLLKIHETRNANIFPFGTSANGKIALSKAYYSYIADAQQGGAYIDSFVSENFKTLFYNVPYKNINWQTQLAFYNPLNINNIKADSFEGLFLNNKLNNNSSFSASAKTAFANLSGNYHVGMKTPIITVKNNGKQVQKNKVKITFKPSELPKLVFPISDNNESWNEFKELFVAQQWNIEVSNTPHFDTIVCRKSKAIVSKYSMPGSLEVVMNDLYNPREEILNIAKKGKYYYRITWSNPTKFDTLNSQHKQYKKTQDLFLSADKTTGATEESESDIEFIENFTTIKNYKYSSIDSFEALDTIVTIERDTPICGLNCVYDIANINRTPSASVVVNDMVDVGLFKMKIKQISYAGNLATGEGSIDCYLFQKPIAVSFKDITFNTDKRLIEGVIKANYRSLRLPDDITDITNTNFSLFDNVKNNILQNLAGLKDIQPYYDLLNANAAFLRDLAFEDEITMPFGLTNSEQETPTNISFTDIVFKADKATFNAAAMVDFDLNGAINLLSNNAIAGNGIFKQYLGFGVKDICLNPRGVSDIGVGGTLELLGNINIPLNDSIKLKILGKENANDQTGTALVWDCKGFKHFNLKASINIGNDILIPFENGRRKDTIISAIGTAQISNFNNFLLSFSLDHAFQFPFLPDYTFKTQHLTLDLSTTDNPVGITFPEEYRGETSTAWRGVYFGELGIRLPNYLYQKDIIAGLHFTAQNFILDANGITGSVGLDNILDTSVGVFAGWKFGINRLALGIVNNVPTNVSVAGPIVCPILKSPLEYEIFTSYHLPTNALAIGFGLKNTGDIAMPAWVANVNVKAGSKLELIGDPRNINSLILQTNINGDISLGGADVAGLKDVRFGTLPFEGLKVITKVNDFTNFNITLEKLGGLDMNRVIADNPSPSGGGTAAINTTGEQETGGFPIAIKNFELKAFNGNCLFEFAQNPAGMRIGLKFKVVVNVADASEGNSIGGECNIGLYAMPRANANLWTVTPAGIDLDTIKINAVLSGVVSIEGGIIFLKNHPTFGNGIIGGVKATFPQNIGITLTGMFGKKDENRYWMIGAGINLPPIPIDFSVGVLYANAFDGEAWYHMNRTPSNIRTGTFELGKSPSGATFIPNANELFGFGGSIGLQGPPGGSPIFGKVGVFAQISNKGGLSRLSFQGDIWFMEPAMEKAPLIVNGTMDIDISRAKINGNLTALVNVAEGAVRGINATIMGGKTYYIAGNVDLLIDFKLNRWHIKMGDPFKKDGNMGFGFYAANQSLFNASGYFMMGNSLPTNLPPINASLNTKLTQSGMASIPNRRSETQDNPFVIMMGLGAAVPEKRIELGPFFAGISIEFAMDGLLKPGFVSCGRDEKGKRRNGMLGWYANGRAIAAINGALGVKLDLTFIPQKELIAGSINAGAILNAGFANPYYINGEFAASFNVLGGLIEGSKTFAFEYLEDEGCRATGSSNISSKFGQIIANHTPNNNENEILIGIKPEIALNYKLNQNTSFQYQEEEERNGRMVPVTKTGHLKAKIDAIFLTKIHGSIRKNINFTTFIVNDGFGVKIKPNEYLGADSSYIVTAKFYMELTTYKMVKGENKPNTSRVKDTTLVFTFRTEKMPEFQEEYILFTRPFQGEQFFKKNESGYGNIKTQSNGVESKFFSQRNIMGGIFKYSAQYVDIENESDTINVPLIFDRGKPDDISFRISDRLTSGKIYHFRLLRERVKIREYGKQIDNLDKISNGNNTTAITGIITNNNTTSGTKYTNNDIETGNKNNAGGNTQSNPVTTINLEQFRRNNSANLDEETIHVLVEFPFKLSRYNTLQEKIDQLTLQDAVLPIILDSMYFRFNTNEPFEQYEVNRVYYNDPDLGNLDPKVKITNVATPNQYISGHTYMFEGFYGADILTNGNRLATAINTWKNNNPSVSSELLPYMYTTNINHKDRDYSTFVFDRHIYKPLAIGSRLFNEKQTIMFSNAEIRVYGPKYKDFNLSQFNNILDNGLNGIFNERNNTLNYNTIFNQGSSENNTTTPAPAFEPPKAGTLLIANNYMFKHIGGDYSALWQKANFVASRNIPVSGLNTIGINRLAAMNKFIYPECNATGTFPLIIQYGDGGTKIFHYRKPCSFETNGSYAIYETGGISQAELNAIQVMSSTSSSNTSNIANDNSAPTGVPQDNTQGSRTGQGPGGGTGRNNR